MMHIRQSTLDTDHLQVAQELETKHLLPLLKVTEYRQLIDQDKSIMWNYIDQFTDLLAGQVEADLGTCKKCSVKVMLLKDEPTRHYCRYSESYRDYERTRMWIPRDEVSALQKAFSRQ